jgi:hypothetical protein
MSVTITRTNRVRSENRCVLIKGVGSDAHEPWCVTAELNNYTVYRYCTSTAV